MTPMQCERAYRKLWDRIIREFGYQPWGIDVPTLLLIHPGFFTARDWLRRESMRWINQRR